jgi:hypothetical protein
LQDAGTVMNTLGQMRQKNGQSPDLFELNYF